MLAESGHVQQRHAHRSASTLPPGGPFGCSLLLTITSWYRPPGPRRHWPPTSTVVATLATGPFVQSSGPTTVSSFRLDKAFVTPTFVPSDCFRTAAATSKSACTKPIGCVHGLPVCCV